MYACGPECLSQWSCVVLAAVGSSRQRWLLSALVTTSEMQGCGLRSGKRAVVGGYTGGIDGEEGN
jgi:hypothetical protein